MRRSKRSALTKVQLVAAGWLVITATSTWGATSLGTAFTYQAELNQNGSPVNDTCDCQFSLWDDPTAGVQVGPTLLFDAGSAIPVDDGLLTVELDFGAGAFNGEARWLEIAVACPSGSALTVLAPRQAVTAAPYALGLPGLRTITSENLSFPASWNVLGGHPDNSVAAGFGGASIFGGGGMTPGGLDLRNRVTADFGSIGGGAGNTAGANATVAGGTSNTAGGNTSTIGGGFGNTAGGLRASVAGGANNAAGGESATVGGGSQNTASGNFAFVGGGGGASTGNGNTASGLTSTVAGGAGNVAGGAFSTLGGGEGNTADSDHSAIGGGKDNFAGAVYSTIAGGLSNGAGGSRSTVSGGEENAASGFASTVPGGQGNRAFGAYSFAAGRQAHAGHSGAFVWADSTTDPFFTSSGDNQFLVRASGNVGINTSNPGITVAIGDDGTGVHHPSPHTLALHTDLEERLRITSTGDIGIGTGSPANRLSVAGGADFTGNLGIGTANPSIHLAISDSGTGVHRPIANSLALHTNNAERLRITDAGDIGIGTSSPANRLSVAGSADFTGNVGIGTTGPSIHLAIGDSGTGVHRPFPQNLALHTNSAERLRIIDNGHVGIGTTVPERRLHIRGEGGTNVNGLRLTHGALGLSWDLLIGGVSNSFNGGLAIARDGNANLGIVVDGNGNVGMGTTTPAEKLHVNGSVQASCGVLTCSDRRFKTKITPLQRAIDVVDKLRPVGFDWRTDEFPERKFPAERQIGLVAQEVEKVLPQVVQRGSDGHFSIDYGRLTPLLVAAVKEVRAEVRQKEAEITELKAQNAELTARLDRIEKLLIEAGQARETTE